MPKWLDNAVFYEIYPQSFLDTNADGIGDFQGIINKLDYIRELGCNALWINPCFLSPFGDAGYDVADYYRVAPRYGTNEDLKRLFADCRERLPEGCRGRPMAVSDVVELNHGAKRAYYYVSGQDQFRQVKFSPMLAKKEIPEKTQERF